MNGEAEGCPKYHNQRATAAAEGCVDGVRARLRVHAYCHDIGKVDNPHPPGVKLPKFLRELQVSARRTPAVSA